MDEKEIEEILNRVGHTILKSIIDDIEKAEVELKNMIKKISKIQKMLSMVKDVFNTLMEEK